MPYKTLTYDISAEGVCTITLNRPDARNALNLELKEELAKAIAAVAEDQNARCVVLTGAGSAFCAGGDIKEMDPDRPPLAARNRHRKLLSTVLLPLARLDKPVIAAVNGNAFGAGCNLALACDMIVASETAVFCQSFVRVGVLPDLGGLYFLQRLVGLNRAKELFFTGRQVKAAEALSLGIANQVVPEKELASAATALATQLANSPATSIAFTKMYLNMSPTMSLEQFVEIESMTVPVVNSAPDHREGVAAFREKRQPKFR